MQTKDDTTERERVFQISSNRGRASHKLRYVEASAPVAGECRLCVGSIVESVESSTSDPSSTVVPDNDE